MVNENLSVASNLEVPTQDQKKNNQKKARSKLLSINDVAVEEKVKARWSGDGNLYEGKIKTINLSNNTCDIQFDDGEFEQAVSIVDIRKTKGEKTRRTAKSMSGKRTERISSSKRKNTTLKGLDFSIGDKVQGRWSGDGNVYPGIIIHINNEEGTCDLKFEAGETEKSVKFKDIQFRNQKKNVKSVPGKNGEANNCTGKVGVDSPQEKHFITHSSHVVRCKRLRLDKALAQGSTDGWSEARIRAFKTRESNPNSYYYRFNDPGETQGKGKWSDEERDLFMKRLKEIGPEAGWGTFSMKIPGRVGYQCSNFYRQLIEAGDIKDENYVIDANGKARFLRQKTSKTSNGSRRARIVPGVKVGKPTQKFGKCGEPTFKQLRAAGYMFKPKDFALLKDGSVAEIREIYEKTDPDTLLAAPQLLARRFVPLQDILQQRCYKKAYYDQVDVIDSRPVNECELVETDVINFKVDAREIVASCDVKYMYDAWEIEKKKIFPSGSKKRNVFFVCYYLDGSLQAFINRTEKDGKLVTKSVIAEEIRDIRRQKREDAWREQERKRLIAESDRRKAERKAAKEQAEQERLEAEAEPEGISEYEKQRAKQVEENLSKLKALGLAL